MSCNPDDRCNLPWCEEGPCKALWEGVKIDPASPNTDEARIGGLGAMHGILHTPKIYKPEDKTDDKQPNDPDTPGLD